MEPDPASNKIVLINPSINANSSFLSGFEAAAKNSLTKWWDITSNLNIYTSKINMDNPNIPTAKQMCSWFVKVNNTFKLLHDFSVQLSADYNSKTVLAPSGSSSESNGGGSERGRFGVNVSGNAQGFSMSTYGVDLAVKYEFLKNKSASITLSGNDLFKTRVSNIYTTTNQFNQHQFRIRDQQLFSINFAYRFGKFDTSLLKRKKIKVEQESMQGGMQGMPQ